MLLPITPKQMIRKLEKAGFVQISQNGSHVKLRNENNITVIVPIHCKDLKKGTETAILKQAGLK